MTERLLGGRHEEICYSALFGLPFDRGLYSQDSRGERAERLIVGTWSMNGMEATAQFGADGSYSTTALGQTATGTYRWVDDNTVELTIAGHTHTIKVAVSQDQFTETDGPNVYTFQRVTANASPRSGASSKVSSGIMRERLSRRACRL